MIPTPGMVAIAVGGSAALVGLEVGGIIADNGELTYGGSQTSKLAGRITGKGTITEGGPGTLLFNGVANGFTGEVVVSGGVVEFAKTNAPRGGVAFEAPSGTTTLMFAAAATPASGGSLPAMLVDFDSATKRIDLLATPYVSGATVTRSGDTLTLTDGAYVAAFTLSGLAAAKYVAASDGHSGTLIHAAVGSPISALAQAAAAFGGGSSPVSLMSAHEARASGMGPIAEHLVPVARGVLL